MVHSGAMGTSASSDLTAERQEEHSLDSLKLSLTVKRSQTSGASQQHKHTESDREQQLLQVTTRAQNESGTTHMLQVQKVTRRNK